MGRLFVLLLIGVAAWYGWKHWTDLRQAPRDEAVVMNESGRTIVRVRLTVAGQTFVRESIPDGGSAEFRMAVSGDGVLALKWQYDREEIDKTWSGGQIAAGPIRTRHIIQVLRGGGVVWNAQRATADQK